MKFLKRNVDLIIGFILLLLILAFGAWALTKAPEIGITIGSWL